jgi:hypothetical protein
VERGERAGRAWGKLSVTYAERDPELVALAKEIYVGGVSLHEVARLLEAPGRVTPSGKRGAGCRS